MLPRHPSQPASPGSEVCVLLMQACSQGCDVAGQCHPTVAMLFSNAQGSTRLLGLLASWLQIMLPLQMGLASCGPWGAGNAASEV